MASDQEGSQFTPEAETTTDTAVISPNPSTSSDSGVGSVKAQKCRSLPTITEGCCEDKDSPVTDIEDLLADKTVKERDGDFKSFIAVTPEDG